MITFEFVALFTKISTNILSDETGCSKKSVNINSLEYTWFAHDNKNKGLAFYLVKVSSTFCLHHSASSSVKLEKNYI